MRRGLLDTFLSRRTMHDKCFYFKRIDYQEYDTDSSVLEYDYADANGFFYAKPVSAEDISANPIAGAFLFDVNTITLQTTDDISDLERNDIVVFRKQKYRVDNIQQIPYRNTNDFVDDITYVYYLRLRR